MTDESHNACILISSCLNKFIFIRTIILIELMTSVTIVYICMLAVYTPSHHEGYTRYKLLSISVWFWCRWQSGWMRWRSVWFNLITMSSWQVWDLVIFKQRNIATEYDVRLRIPHHPTPYFFIFWISLYHTCSKSSWKNLLTYNWYFMSILIK